MAHQTKDPATGKYAPRIVQPHIEELKAHQRGTTPEPDAKRCPACGLTIATNAFAGHVANCNAKGALDS